MIFHLESLQEACNITSVNTSLVSKNAYETMPEREREREKTFADVFY